MFSGSPIKLIIADDHALFRKGIKSIFTNLNKEEFNFIGEAADGMELVALLTVQQPDIVLMDVEMPKMNGIEATAIVSRDFPLVRTIALSCADSSQAVLDMVSAGAEGYLLKDSGLEELTRAIRTVHAGAPYFTPLVSIHLTAKAREGQTIAGTPKKKGLTRRETQILQLICEGKSSKEIAAALCVSKRTIDSFREKIMKKACAKNLLQLFRYALKNRLLKD